MSTLQNVNFEPVSDVLPVVRRNFPLADKTLIQRHRLIHAAVADLMRREIHALSINKAQTPNEARSSTTGT